MTGYVSIEKFSGGSTYYLKTTDGGVTWSDQLFQNFQYDIQGIGFLTQSKGWLGGWGGNTYETTDGGASWHLAGFGYIVNRFRFLNQYLAYAVGQTVYKYSFFSCTAVSGDADGSGGTPGLSDIIHLVNYVFKDGLAPSPLCRGDATADGSVTVPDIVYLVNFVFKGGAEPIKVETCCL